MTIKLTHDIFCDSCLHWEFADVVSTKVLRRTARKNAHKEGWTTHEKADGTLIDLCPQCSKLYSPEVKP